MRFTTIMMICATTMATAFGADVRNSMHTPHSVAKQIVSMAKRNAKAEVLTFATTLWREGFRNAQLARHAATISAEMGNGNLACEWLEKMLEVSPETGTELMVLGDYAAEPLDVDSLRQEKSFDSIRRTDRFRAIMERVKTVSMRHNAKVNPGSDVVRGELREAGLDLDAVAKLVKACGESNTSSLIILKDGKLVGEWFFDGWTRRIETQSASKSLVSLAIGVLVSEGKLKTLDEPVWKFFPEWKQGRKANITIRHLLNHTSGIQALRNTEDIYPAPDFVQLALSAELTTDPGATFFYNNKAVNLLPAIIKKIAGIPMDKLLDERVFGPMGITDYQCSHDSAGNILAMSGWRMHPVDLAKIGQMLLNGGVYNGKRIVASEWILESTSKASQPYDNTCGLLWWLNFPEIYRVFQPGSVDTLRGAGWTTERIVGMGVEEGRRWKVGDLYKVWGDRLNDMNELESVLQKAGKSPIDVGVGIPAGFVASGDLGQYLFVIPKSKLVVVRMAATVGASYENTCFGDIYSLVSQLASTSKW